MLKTPELQALQRLLSWRFWLFVAVVVTKLAIDYAGGGSSPARQVLFWLAGLAVFFPSYIVYAIGCVRVAKSLGRSGSLTTAYFVVLPFAVALLSILQVVVAIAWPAVAGLRAWLWILDTTVFLLLIGLDASPIAFYLSLRSGLDAAHHDAIFED
jgi:hypothetical protein